MIPLCWSGFRILYQSAFLDSSFDCLVFLHLVFYGCKTNRFYLPLISCWDLTVKDIICLLLMRLSVLFRKWHHGQLNNFVHSPVMLLMLGEVLHVHPYKQASCNLLMQKKLALGNKAYWKQTKPPPFLSPWDSNTPSLEQELTVTIVYGDAVSLYSHFCLSPSVAPCV